MNKKEGGEGGEKMAFEASCRPDDEIEDRVHRDHLALLLICFVVPIICFLPRLLSPFFTDGILSRLSASNRECQRQADTRTGFSFACNTTLPEKIITFILGLRGRWAVLYFVRRCIGV